MASRVSALATALCFAVASLTADATVTFASSANTAALRTRYLQHREWEHQRSMENIMGNLTVTSALNLVRNASSSKPEVMSFVLESLSGHKKKNLRTGKQLEKSLTMDTYDGLERARAMLNGMIQETQVKYDMELEKCCTYDEYQSERIEDTRQDISRFNAEAAECRASVLQASSVIELCEIKLPQLTDVLEGHNAECSEQIAELRSMLKIVLEDLEIMELIIGMLNCDAAASASFIAQQCEVEGENGCKHTYTSFEQHKELDSALSKLKSDTAKQLIQDNMNASQDAATDSAGAASVLNTTTTWAPQELPAMQKLRSRPCKMPMANFKRAAKCVPGGPNCLVMLEKFQYIKAGIEDKRDDLQEQLDDLEHHCDEQRANLEAQIADFEFKLKDSQTSLAVATKCLNDAEENSRLKSIDLKALNADYAHWTKTCHDNYEAFEGEICGIKKIRTEIYKVKGDPGKVYFYQDCVVSEWTPSECSATCGANGILTLTRKVLREPHGGASCPVLLAQEKCNRHKCPVDCVLGLWSGWSSCTAKCGGGVQERSREIDVEPQHGGEPCGETSESLACNIQSCDKDCVLSDWTIWSECSKECDGGTIERSRSIVEQAIGGGECPADRDETRLEVHACHEFPCEFPATEAMLHCNATLDVVMVIDGSGSLREDGWEASVKAAAMLARAFGGSDVMLAVILFSKETKIVEHFTSDIEKAATAIEAMEWPKKWTFTANALNTAKDELSMGREEAQSVVIVFTDGKPMSARNTLEASKQLRKLSRLLWVPVTAYAPLQQIKEWASYPKEENVVPVADFEHLVEPDILSMIVADVCPHVI